MYVYLQLALAGDEEDDEDDETDNDDYSGINASDNAAALTDMKSTNDHIASLSVAGGSSANKTNLNLHTLLTPQTPHMKRQASLDSHINNTGQVVATAMTHKKRKLIHSNLLAKFAQPCFPMFESQGYINPLS